MQYNIKTKCKQKLTGGLKFRDERIDSVKYWLIVLVIIGHIFVKYQSVKECIVITNWIYIFHMPLFIFISGYFSHKKEGRPFLSDIWKLAEPLIIFQIVAIVTGLIFGGTISYKKIFTPWWALWYLLSLIYWRILLQIIPDRVLNNTKIVLSVTFFVSIISGFFPFDRFLSIQRTLSFMIFFFLGYYVKMKGINFFFQNKWKPLCIVFLLFSFVFPISFHHYLGDLNHADPYIDCYGPIKRLFVFCLSIPMSLAFVNLCINRPKIARQGRLTMQYYIYHALIIPPFMLLVNKLDIPNTLFSATAYSMIIISGIGLASFLPFFNKLTNPSSFIK